MTLPAVSALLSLLPLTTFLTPEVWTSPHTKQFSATPAPCPTIQPSSELAGVSEEHAVKGSVSPGFSPLPPL